MKRSTIPVLFRTMILALLVTLVKPDYNITDPRYGQELLNALTATAVSTNGNHLLSHSRNIGKLAKGFIGIGFLGDMYVLAKQATVQEALEENLRTIQLQLNEVEKKANLLSNQVSEVATALNDDIDYLSHVERTEWRLTHFVPFFNNINIEARELGRIKSRYTGHALVENLQKFISSFTGGAYGSHLLFNLNTEFLFIKPLVDDLIIRGRKKYEAARWSTSTMIFNMHATVLKYLKKENSILEVAYIFLQYATRINMDLEFTKLQVDRYNIIQRFYVAYRNTYQNKLNNEDCVQQFKPDILKNDKIVSLKFLLQQIWVEKSWLRKHENVYKADCEEYWDLHNPGSFCFGGFVKCGFGASVDICGKDVIYQQPPVDATYSAIGSEDVHKWLRDYAPHVISRGFPKCYVPTAYAPWKTIEMSRAPASEISLRHDLCACVCDQYRFQNATRRFYVKVIAAPIGHVITGVRFVEENHAIFLQIQSGELLAMGIVNENVEWQPLPSNTKPEDYHLLDYWRRSVVLNSLKAPKKDEFITAISFEPHELGVRFRTYKRKVNSFADGTLWHKLRKTPVHRIKISREEVREFWDLIPTLSEERILMEVTKPLAVKFGMSSWADYKQTCIPYFDGSDVEFGIKVPLTDIRFVHYTNHAELTSIDYNYFYFLE